MEKMKCHFFSYNLPIKYQNSLLLVFFKLNNTKHLSIELKLVINHIHGHAASKFWIWVMLGSFSVVVSISWLLVHIWIKTERKRGNINLTSCNPCIWFDSHGKKWVPRKTLDIVFRTSKIRTTIAVNGNTKCNKSVEDWRRQFWIFNVRFLSDKRSYMKLL